MKGFYRVTHLENKERSIRDFDAEVWRYSWLKKNDVEILRLDEIPQPGEGYLAFAEFSTPVSLEFIPED